MMRLGRRYSNHGLHTCTQHNTYSSFTLWFFSISATTAASFQQTYLKFSSILYKHIPNYVSWWREQIHSILTCKTYTEHPLSVLLNLKSSQCCKSCFLHPIIINQWRVWHRQWAGTEAQRLSSHDEDVRLDQMCRWHIRQRDDSHSSSMTVLQHVGRALVNTEISTSDAETSHD